MRHAAVVLSVIACPTAAPAQTLACQASDGIYVQSGHSAFSAASSYDATVLKKKFYVERSTGTVVGSALYSTDGMKREVVRNDDKALAIRLRTSLGDTFVMKFVHSSERWTFTYYSSWLNLLLVGVCEPS